MGIQPKAILLEPVGRNTAPAVALAALVARAGEVPGSGLSPADSPVPGTSSPDPLLLVLPADHVIRDVAAFQAAVVKALPAARAGQLVTFGVVPTHAESGYGYIRKAAGPGPVVPVAEFVEKPDAARAAEFVASGEYLWNSGMFLFSARRYLEELARHAPAMAEACGKAFAGARRDLDFTRVPAVLFAPCPSDSIDYAVMEKTDAAAVVPLAAGWSDVGSWASLKDALPGDAHNNAEHGDVVSVDVRVLGAGQ